MISEISKNKFNMENRDKSKIYDNLLRACNEKGLFPIPIENPNNNYNKISSPIKKLLNKNRIELSSVKKENSSGNKSYVEYSGNKLPEFIYGHQTPQNNLSEKKDYYESELNIHKDFRISGKKRIRHKLNNIFDSIKTKSESPTKKKKNFQICLTIDNILYDILLSAFNSNERNNMDILKNTEKFSKEEQISCICLKSKCLNNYCSCHKKNLICNRNCRCIQCNNTVIKNEESTLNKLVDGIILTCKCKNSHCLSRYCECKKRNKLCNKECQCSQCKNYI